MNVTDITNVTNPAATANMTQLKAKALGKEDFLKLLVAQLSNQDPTNPTDNKEMILQLSQFSTLEATNNLSDSLAASAAYQNVGTASAMIGKTVTFRNDNNAEVTGVVQRVNIGIDNSIRLVVDGQSVAMGKITSVAETPVNNNPAALNGAI